MERFFGRVAKHWDDEPERGGNGKIMRGKIMGDQKIANLRFEISKMDGGEDQIEDDGSCGQIRLTRFAG